MGQNSNKFVLDVVMVLRKVVPKLLLRVKASKDYLKLINMIKILVLPFENLIFKNSTKYRELSERSSLSSVDAATNRAWPRISYRLAIRLKLSRIQIELKLA